MRWKSGKPNLLVAMIAVPLLLIVASLSAPATDETAAEVSLNEIQPVEAKIDLLRPGYIASYIPPKIGDLLRIDFSEPGPGEDDHRPHFGFHRDEGGEAESFAPYIVLPGPIRFDNYMHEREGHERLRLVSEGVDQKDRQHRLRIELHKSGQNLRIWVVREIDGFVDGVTHGTGTVEHPLVPRLARTDEGMQKDE